ncbi:MAG: GNAT family N-acetyltransferase [Saprospiraceae bacterium]
MNTNLNYFKQESERLTYRKLTPDDIPKWITFFINNDRLRFLGMDESIPKEQLAADWINMQFKRYENTNLGHLAVERKADGTFIGLCGILPRELDGKKEFEIAYSLIPTYWKQGYGTEMATQMKQFATKNIDTKRFISIIHIDNIDSMNVAKKNGMNVLFRTEFMGMIVDVFGIEK